MQHSIEDSKKLLTEVIKKQIAILGPQIAIEKARSVQGLIVADDGTVTDITGQAQVVTQALIDQFVQLSGLIVQKTMESLLTGFPNGQTPVVNVSQPPSVRPMQTQSSTTEAIAQH